MDLSTLARFHIAPGFDPAAPDTWVWTDRSADVNHTSSTALTITGDRSDEASTVSPGSAGFEVDNAGGHYCTKNPNGRWYGLLARNCPARWGTISGAEAWTTNTTNGWGTPDVGTSWTLQGSASNWSSAGGVGQLSLATANLIGAGFLNGADARNGDATFVASVPAVATGASFVSGLLVRRTASVNQIWFCIDFGVSGVLGVRIKRDSGGLSDIGSGTAGTYTAGQRIKARCVWDGNDLRMRIWPESGSEPTTWTAVATDTQCMGAAVGLQFWRLAGNTNAGAVVMAVDSLEIEAVEITGTIPAFPVRWDPTATQSWAPLEIAGIGRRLSQGQPNVRSPMYLQISSYSRLIGYWPIEDGTRATQLASGVSGGKLGSARQMTFGAQGPDGSASAATFVNSNPTSQVGGAFLAASTTAGWQISWSVELPSLPAQQNNMLTWFTSNGYTWQLNTDVNVFNLTVTDGNGTVLTNTNMSFVGTSDPARWITYRLKATASGGTVTAEFAWYEQGMGTPWGATVTFSGSVGALKSWVANGNATKQGAGICQVYGVTTGLDDLQSYDSLRAFDGYVGELASDRAARLCATAGVQIAIEAGDSEPMGRQPAGGLFDLLRVAEAADMGVLYEAGAGLAYRPRQARYNRPVAVALQIGSGGDIADPAPEPTDDDQRISNEWTVGRTDGSESTQSDPAHIALNGRYPQSTTINIASDERLDDQANWRIHLGTWGEMRWPQITLDLTDKPALLTFWRGRVFGPRITIAGVPSQGPIGDLADLIVEGWSQDIGSDHWRVTLNCSPARPWDVGIYDDAGSRRDSTSTALGVARDAVQTSWTFSTANTAETWSTSAGDYPLDVNCGGERVTVTAMGAVTGSGPFTQTATVTRSVNSIVKAQLINTPISLWRPVYRGL